MENSKNTHLLPLHLSERTFHEIVIVKLHFHHTINGSGFLVHPDDLHNKCDGI